MHLKWDISDIWFIYHSRVMNRFFFQLKISKKNPDIHYTVIDWMFDPRMDLLPEAAGWGQQIRSRVKQNCCCTRSKPRTVLLYTFIFQKFSYSLFPLTYPLDGFNSQRIWTTPRHCDVTITWLIEPMEIRPSVNSSIAGSW